MAVVAGLQGHLAWRGLQFKLSDFCSRGYAMAIVGAGAGPGRVKERVTG